MIFALLYRIILNESKRLSSNEESIRKELIRKEIVWKSIRVRGERRCSSLEEENCIKMQVARVTWWNNAESPMIVGAHRGTPFSNLPKKHDSLGTQVLCI